MSPVVECLEQHLEQYAQVENRLRELTDWNHFLGWLRAQPRGMILGRNGSYTDCLIARYLAQHFPEYHVWTDVFYVHMWEKKPGETIKGDWVINPPAAVPVYFTLPTLVSMLIEELGSMDLEWLHARTCLKVAERLP